MKKFTLSFSGSCLIVFLGLAGVIHTPLVYAKPDHAKNDKSAKHVEKPSNASSKPDSSSAKNVSRITYEEVVAGRVSRDLVRQVLGNDVRYLSVGAKPLPPGIAKNLSRGKPIPPGIAKQRVPDQLYGRLPHIEGKEWVRIGTELVLIGIATGVIEEIVENVFD